MNLFIYSKGTERNKIKPFLYFLWGFSSLNPVIIPKGIVNNKVLSNGMHTEKDIHALQCDFINVFEMNCGKWRLSHISYIYKICFSLNCFNQSSSWKFLIHFLYFILSLFHLLHSSVCSCLWMLLQKKSLSYTAYTHSVSFSCKNLMILRRTWISDCFILSLKYIYFSLGSVFLSALM